MAITNELSNVPAATFPFLALFALLTIGYILLLGPANFLVLRLIGRQQLAWITIPALALSYLGSTVGITTHLKSSSVVLNSVGMVTLDQSGSPHHAIFYLGLVASMPGDYHLTYHAPALPAPIPELAGCLFRCASPPNGSPLGMKLQEGSQTDVTFLGMKSWSVRDVSLDTTIRVPGTVQSDLRVGAQGDIIGTIHNATNLDLLDPVIVAGQSITHLPNIPVGATIHPDAQPFSTGSSQDQSSVWATLYGGPDLTNSDGFGGGFGWCCEQSSFPREGNLTDRARNVVAMLEQAQTLSTLGEVVLAGWTQQPLGSFTVDGTTPQQRALNFVVMPLSVGLPTHGSFRLRTGTLGAHLVDIVPQPPQSSCCNWFSRNVHQISVGPGGSVTFELDIPDARRARFQRLALTVNSGTYSGNVGRVFSWRARRWVQVDFSTGTAKLSAPNRFISPDGQILLKLQATSATGDITIDDPYQDVQISGTGTAT
jgi:hypothetical protein